MAPYPRSRQQPRPGNRTLGPTSPTPSRPGSCAGALAPCPRVRMRARPRPPPPASPSAQARPGLSVPRVTLRSGCPARHGRRQGFGGAEAVGGLRARAAFRAPAASPRVGVHLPRGPARLRAAPRGPGGSGECGPSRLRVWCPFVPPSPDAPPLAVSSPPAVTPTPVASPLPTLYTSPRGVPFPAPIVPASRRALPPVVPCPRVVLVSALLPQVLSGCGVYDGTEIHEASA